MLRVLLALLIAPPAAAQDLVVTGGSSSRPAPPAPASHRSRRGPDEALLLAMTVRLGGELLDPIKTTNVQGLRCMTTWVVRM